MDPRKNPYTPSAGQRPAYLAGRDEDVENLRLLIERLADGRQERSVIYTGLRGTGKTVLLGEFEALAREAGWFSASAEVGRQGDFRVTFGRLASQALRSMSLKDRMKSRAKAALGVVHAFSALAPGGVKLALDVAATSGKADSGDPEEDLAELLAEVGEVAALGGTGVLFLVDEMQNLDLAALSAICMAFHRVGQRSLPVALGGAGLPSLRRLLLEAKPYAARLFRYEELGPLPDGVARIAVVRPAAVRQVGYQEPALDLIVKSSGGYPYFLQEYGRIVWNEAERSPITSADVIGVREIVTDQLASDFFSPQFEIASDAEQRYLMAMADLGDGPFRSSEVNRRLGHTSRSGSSQERHNLIKKELLWSPRRGLVDFTVPGFAEFLRTRYPFAADDAA